MKRTKIICTLGPASNNRETLKALMENGSNSITVFTVDYEKNIIMMNEKPRKIETPNSIHIWPVPGDVDGICK